MLTPPCFSSPTGPPESVRDHIMAATRSLLQGDWAAAYAFIAKLPVWVLVPQRESVLGMLKVRGVLLALLLASPLTLLELRLCCPGVARCRDLAACRVLWFWGILTHVLHKPARF